MASSYAIFWRDTTPVSIDGGVVFGDGTGYKITDTDQLNWDDANTRLGIGTINAPGALLTLALSTDVDIFHATKYFDSTAGPAFFFRKGRGSEGTPAAVQSGDSLGAVVFRGYTSAGAFSSTIARGPNCFTAEGFTGSAQGSYLVYDTTPIGSTTPTTRLLVSSNGNIGIGPTTNAGANPTAGTMGLVFGDGTALSGMPSNTAGIYADDVAGTVEIFVIDEGGAASQISPHNFTLFEPDITDPYPWSYFSKNEYLGQVVNVDIGKLARLVENLTGEKLIYRDTIPQKEWTENQAHHARQAMAAYEIWERQQEGPAPALPAYKAPPKWLADRIAIDPAKEAAIVAEIETWKAERPTRREPPANRVPTGDRL